MAPLIREYDVVLESPHAGSVRMRVRGYDGADAASIARVFCPRHVVTAIEPVPSDELPREEPKRAP